MAAGAWFVLNQLLSNVEKENENRSQILIRNLISKNRHKTKFIASWNFSYLRKSAIPRRFLHFSTGSTLLSKKRFSQEMG